MKILVIGGGAAGMMAAIAAAGNGIPCTLLERNALPGKKILSTGNGRCNLTNQALNPALYQGSCGKLAATLLREFGVKDAINFFKRIGIPTVSAASAQGNDAWVYPACREAAAVRLALELECRRLGVNMVYEQKIISIEKEGKRFILHSEGGEVYEGDRVILTTGGKAFPKSGSDGSGYELAQSLGHSLVEPLPALGALISDSPHCSAMAGVRVEASVSLMINQAVAAQETGEVQMTDYGLSGIPVFQLSGRAVRALTEGKSVLLRLNLMAASGLNEVFLNLSERKIRRGMEESGTLLLGLVPDKMVPTLLKIAGIPLHIPCSQIDRDALMKLAFSLQNLEFEINDAKDFDACQVTGGGIPASEISLNLESLKTGGLFFAGEILDLDGPCGGYNLQWAWTSGHKAGMEAAR